mmetsp:Transcript_28746/g.43861  ORF Transcript_28746/g.43861 Transcript_28746/m.43861 type:complete len:443 (-) Transcript_28746:2899-4227(-)
MVDKELHVLTIIILLVTIDCYNGFTVSSHVKSGSSRHRCARPSDCCTHLSQLVPRITLEEYLASPVYTKPILITDIVKPDVIESMTGDLLNILGNEVVQMQRKTRCTSSDVITTTQTEIYDIMLKETIDYMMVDSSHEDSFFTFCEGMIPSALAANDVKDDLSNISNQLMQIRETPFSGGENWFDYFPTSVRPTDALVLAGCGSTSTLHRDPFEWTGTSLCLEGTKIWRFITPPLDEDGSDDIAMVDELLGSYRLDSIAWSNDEENVKDGDLLVLSAGWQSDFSLFDSISYDIPSAMELLKLEEYNKDEYILAIESMGRDPSRLGLDAKSQSALQTLKARTSSDNEPAFLTAIQRAGDLLLIPPHCWHQTYAPVPSVAVASQRCGAEIDGSNVIGHVLDVLKRNETAEKSPLPDILKRSWYKEGVGKDAVSGLLQYLSAISR